MYPDNTMASKDLEPEEDSDRVSFVHVKEEPDKTATILQSTSDVNFRLTPDIKRTDNIIGVLKKGLNVTLLEDKGEWKYVEFEHKKGYIRHEYLKEV